MFSFVKPCCVVFILLTCLDLASQSCYEDWSRCTPGTSFWTGILWKNCNDRCKEFGRRGGKCVDSPSKSCPWLLRNNKQLTASGQSTSNLALGKMVNRSTADQGSSAFNVVDGNTGSKLVVSQMGKQWLSISIIWLYQVKNITIIMPAGSLTMSVGVTNNDPNNQTPTTSNTCPLSTSTSTKMMYVCPDDVQYLAKFVIVSQLVVVLLPLQISEVEIYGTWGENSPPRINVLLNQAALMLSYRGIYTASKAVDGFRDTDLTRGFCAQTNEINLINNWLQIDMQGMYYIDYVAVTSPITQSDASKMDSFRVGFLLASTKTPPSSPQIPLCGNYPGVMPIGSRVTLQCNANLPSFKVIIIQQTSALNGGQFPICEVEAYPAVNENRLVWNKVRTGYYLTAHQQPGFSNIPLRSRIHCAIMCSRLGPKSCDSYNYSAVLKSCQFNSHRTGYPNSDLLNDLNWSVWTASYADTLNF